MKDNLKRDRINAGDEVADDLANYLFIKTKKKVMLSSVLPEWTPFFDLKNGDIFINNNNDIIRIDVKRGSKQSGKVFVSLKSALNFEGEYFAFVFKNQIDQTYFYRSRTIKAYMLTVRDSGNLIIGPSGDEGHYFKPWRIQTKISIEDFIKQL